MKKPESLAALFGSLALVTSMGCAAQSMSGVNAAPLPNNAPAPVILAVVWQELAACEMAHPVCQPDVKHPGQYIPTH